MATDEKRKRAEDGAGSIEWRAKVACPKYCREKGCAHGRWRPRIPLPNGERVPWKFLPPRTSALKAREHAAWLTEQFRNEPQKYLPALEARRARRAQGQTATAATGPNGPTVSQFGAEWTDGVLLRRHGSVNRLREKRHTSMDADRLERMCAIKTRGPSGPDFGELAVADVKETDIEAVMAHVPAAIVAWKEKHQRPGPARATTINSHLQVLSRLFDLAEYPCRLRPKNSNPVDRRLRVAKDGEKVFSFLLPTEFLALLACAAIPLGRKVLYVLGCYLGLRKANLLGLRWSDIDLAEGIVTVIRTKNGHPVCFELHFPSLHRFLAAWWEYSGRPKGDARVVPDIGCAPEDTRKVLLDDLRAAGVTRGVLFSGDPMVERLRFHDLRSTFVVWAKRAGYSDGFVSDRTSHLTKAMLDRYDRAKRSIEAARFEPFPSLDGVITELPPANEGSMSPGGSPPSANGHLGGGAATGHAREAAKSAASHAIARPLNPLAEGSSPSWPTRIRRRGSNAACSEQIERVRACRFGLRSSMTAGGEVRSRFA